MRMRQKAVAGMIALGSLLAFGKCSPLIENAHAQERPVVTAPTLAETAPIQPAENPPTTKDTGRKTLDTRPADCPSVVYEPDERCGLERRPWKGGPISEEELRKGEEALILDTEFSKCIDDWIRKWGAEIKKGMDIPRDAKGCTKEANKAEKFPPALMLCEQDQTKDFINSTSEGAEILRNNGDKIFIRWVQSQLELAIVVHSEETKKEEEHRFRFSIRPRYAIISTNKNYVELVIWDKKTQLRFGLDESCRLFYSINPDT